MVNSSDKGKRGERMFARFLRRYGYDARRGKQFSGGDDSPDVVHSVPGIHFEVKFTEALRISEALTQAWDDCGDRVPVIAWKKKRHGWVAILPMDDLMKLIASK